jgi:hypothetical protein
VLARASTRDEERRNPTSFDGFRSVAARAWYTAPSPDEETSMLRSISVASLLVLAAAAGACAESASDDWGSDAGGAIAPRDDASVGGEGGPTGAGVDASGGGEAGATGEAGAGEGGALTLVDGGVSLGDAATPTNCTIGAAGAIALIPAETMAPGTACAGCHLAIGKPLYIAGTVYPTYHEPDLCLGVTGVEVEIVDKSGASHLLAVDSSGNFLDQGAAATYPQPWKAAVLRGSARRDMISTVTSGDCNSCHTAAGANAAPGRVIPP